MNIPLIVVLAVAAFVVVLILIKKSGKKVPPAETADEDIASTAVEDITEAGEEGTAEEREFEPVAPTEPAAEKAAGETPEAEPEYVEEQEIEVPPQAVDTAEEEPVAPAPQLTAEISLESYEQRLMSLKEQRLAALSAAIENNEENRREQLQVELVSLTEALGFLQQNYDQEMSCRSNALAALEEMKPELSAEDYERAIKSLRTGDGEEAEQIFDAVAESNTGLAALAAYQSGSLAQCRLDFNTAMERLEQAASLDAESPEIIRSAALLARNLYQHKKALAWFISLVKLLEAKGEDTVELALARREQAYTAALVGQHKQAGALYKQAMVSLSSLVGNDDPEMGICWYQIGKLQEALGQYEKAEEPYRKALAIMDKTQDNPAFGDILNKLAGLYMELEREPEAIPLFERLCAFMEKSSHPDNASLAMAYNNLAEAFRICGKYGEAETSFRQSLTITEELRGKDHAAVGSLLQELAQLCERQGKKDEAKAFQERAGAIFQRVLEEQEAAGQESGKLNL